MKRSYSLAQVANPVEVLRKAGYAYFKDPQSGEESYVLRLSSDFYPRFHLYVNTTDDVLTFNLHLDQKKASYGKETMHSGEYDGPTVEKEMKRLDGWVQAFLRQGSQDTSEHDSDEQASKQQKRQGQVLKTWWLKLWGKN